MNQRSPGRFVCRRAIDREDLGNSRRMKRKMEAVTTHGTVVKIQRLLQRGVIRGDDERQRAFRRADMLKYLEFLDMRPGDRVRFDEEGERAINVERVLSKR